MLTKLRTSNTSPELCVPLPSGRGSTSLSKPAAPLPAAVTVAENSEVSPVVKSVAVALTTFPAVTTAVSPLMVAAPAGLVVTLLAPMNNLPSPLPEASAVVSEKNSMRNVRFAVLVSVPLTVVLEPLVAAPVSNG